MRAWVGYGGSIVAMIVAMTACSGGDSAGGGGSTGGGGNASTGGAADSSGGASDGGGTAVSTGGDDSAGGASQDSGPSCADLDGDGYTTCDGDCQDDDRAIHPCADDIALDGVDQNCNGVDRGGCDDTTLRGVYVLSADATGTNCTGASSGFGLTFGQRLTGFRLPEDASCGSGSVTFQASFSDFCQLTVSSLYVSGSFSGTFSGDTASGSYFGSGTSCLGSSCSNVSGTFKLRRVALANECGADGGAPVPSDSGADSGVDHGSWQPTGSMRVARASFGMVALRDGRVLVAGGNTIGGPNFTDSIEIWSPSTNTWSDGPNLPLVGTAGAVVLADGRVLLVGSNFGSALYDPTTGSLAAPLGGQPTFTLGTEIVLLTGGTALDVSGASSGIFDPVGEIWTPAPAPTVPGGAAVRLSDGRVLVAGETAFGGTAVDRFTADGSTLEAVAQLPDALMDPGVALVPGGDVLAGGFNDAPRAYRYTPSTDQWRTPAQPAYARIRTNYVTLAGGFVLTAGGAAGGAERPTELYDAALDSWSNAGWAHGAHQEGSRVVTLSGGCRAMLAGGIDSGSGVTSAAVDILTMPDGLSCDDGDAGTVNDMCGSGACIGS